MVGQVSYETVVAAHGLVADPHAAEKAIAAMTAAKLQPSDYAWCSLVAAYRYLPPLHCHLCSNS